MAEKSYLWTTGGAGDGGTTYTRSETSKFMKVAAACHGFEGVAPNLLKSLEGEIPGANTFRITNGGAMVDGKPYLNEADVDVTIPSAVGGGNTRIDRIVLRADWTAQTVRVTRLAGVDAGSPVAPAVTQTSESVYDIKLYQVRVDTSGVVTIELDERTMALVTTAGLADANVTTAKLADDGVTDAKLRNSAAVSVIGRSANSTGNPGDIAAAANDRVLKRKTNALTFAQVETADIADGNVTTAKIADANVTTAKIADANVTTGKIADANVTTAKIADANVTTAKIADANVTTGKVANDAIDDTKVGNRVPQFYRRQGGDASDWQAPGSTNYTPTAVRMQAGVKELASVTNNNTSTASVTFPQAFSSEPLVWVSVIRNDGIPLPTGGKAYTWAVDIGAGGFTIYLNNQTGATLDFVVAWLAIGPE